MKKLLLHSCCAPCSSSVLERLGDDYHITIYYYNPNMDSATEFERRANELKKLKSIPLKYGYDIVIEDCKPEEFDDAVMGLEDLGEGSQRCYNCYELRMRKTAEHAVQNDFDVFTTTLSVSPYKKSAWISEIGKKLAAELSVAYMDENFKKHDGFKRSVELSNELGLYQQNYCACKYSKIEAMQKRRPVL